MSLYSGVSWGGFGGCGPPGSIKGRQKSEKGKGKKREREKRKKEEKKGGDKKEKSRRPPFFQR